MGANSNLQQPSFGNKPPLVLAKPENGHEEDNNHVGNGFRGKGQSEDEENKGVFYYISIHVYGNSNDDIVLKIIIFLWFL